MPIRPEMKDRYPADWRLRSDFVRFQRAQGQCEWIDDGVRCGRHHYDPIKGNEKSTVVLTAAHLYDHRPEKASLLNLAALCQKHHLAYDLEMRWFAKQLRSQIELKDEVVWQIESGFGKYVWGFRLGTVIHRAKMELRWFEDMPKYQPCLVKWDRGQRTVMIRNQEGWNRSGLLR